MGKKHRIYYHHTDSGGVVYYANYLEFLEEARTDFLEGKGISIKEMVSQGFLFVVARQEIDYKLPAFYADVLEVETRLGRVSGVKLEFEYGIKNQRDQAVCTAKTILACVDNTFKPQLIPEDIRKKLAV